MNLTKKTIQIISLAIFLLLAAIVTFLPYKNFEQKRDSYYARLQNELSTAYAVTIFANQEIARIVFDTYINQPDILELYKNANSADESVRNEVRQQLMKKLGPLYEQLKLRDIRQFQFHLTNSESFLRFHRPDKYGDNLKGIRYSVDKANAELVAVSGFEEGRVHNGFRNVFPLIYHGEHLGSVEISMDFDPIRKQMEQQFHNRYAFMVRHHIVEEKDFADEQSFYKPSVLSDDYLYERNYDADDTINAINAILRPKIQERLKTGEGFVVEAKASDATRLVVFFPIKNVQGQQVAYIVSYNDDDTIHSYYSEFIIVLAASIAGILIIIALLYLLANAFRRIRAEKVTLQLEREQFQIFTNTYPSLTFIKDANCRYLFADKQTADFFGKSIDDILGKTDREIAEEGKIVPYPSSDKKALESDTVVTIEEKLGDHIFEVIKFTFTLPGGEKGIGGIMNDITERKHAEEKLKAFNKQLQAMEQQLRAANQQLDASNIEIRKNLIYTLENMIDGFVSLDENWHYTYVNKKAGEMLGRKPEDLVGKHIWTEFSEGIKQPFYKNYYKAVETQKAIFFEDYYQPWDRWFQNRVFPFKKGLSIFFHDITERKQAEDKLKAANQQLEANNQQLLATEQQLRANNQQLIASEKALKESASKLNAAQHLANIGDFSWNVISGEVTWSDGMYQLLKYDKDENINLAEVNMKIHHPDDLDRITKWLNDSLASGKDKLEPNEYRLIRKDGKVILVHTEGYITHKNGKAVSVFGMCQDITERKLAEEELQRSETLFRAITEQSGEGIALADNSGNYVKVNPALCKTTGFSEEELLTMNVRDLIPPETEIKLFPQVRNGKSGKREIELLRKDGSHFMAEINGYPLQLAGQNLVLGITRDITERKQAEKALKESEERFRLLTENTLDTIWSTDQNFNTIFVNNAVTKFLGYTPEEFLALKSKEFISKEGMKILQEAAEKLIFEYKQGNITQQKLELKYIRKDGKIIDVELTANLLFNDKKEFIGFQGRSIDITERKQAEEALRESEERFRQAFTTSPDSISISRLDDGMYVSINDGFTKITGYAESDVIGKTSREINLWANPEDREKLVDGIRKHGRVKNLELQFRMKNGKVVYGLTSAAVINLDGIPHLISVTRDITERKQAEEELRKYREHLEELVKERTEKLQSSNKELEAFAYSVSHDLRAPLRAIDGFTRILIEDYVKKLDDEGKRLGSVIQKSAQKMGKLIDDLLAFSRLGRTSMKFSGIDMKNMVNAIYHEASSSSERKRIKITVTDLPDAYGDTNMMRQVWTNLISNAIKFSSRRGKAVISITGTQDDEKTTYRISDNGVGFEMQYVNKIFDVFQRLHTDKEFPGTGVGLSLVQRIIHRHNGKIWAESEVDKGATFYFSLPKKRINETNKL